MTDKSQPWDWDNAPGPWRRDYSLGGPMHGFRLFPIDDGDDWGCPTWTEKEPTPVDLYWQRIKARGPVKISQAEIDFIRQDMLSRDPGFPDFEVSG